MVSFLPAVFSWSGARVERKHIFFLKITVEEICEDPMALRVPMPVDRVIDLCAPRGFFSEGGKWIRHRQGKVLSHEGLDQLIGLVHGVVAGVEVLGFQEPVPKAGIVLEFRRQKNQEGTQVLLPAGGLKAAKGIPGGRPEICLGCGVRPEEKHLFSHFPPKQGCFHSVVHLLKKGHR